MIVFCRYELSQLMEPKITIITTWRFLIFFLKLIQGFNTRKRRKLRALHRATAVYACVACTSVNVLVGSSRTQQGYRNFYLHN